ncbi:MAG TPA: DUF1800 domain-containing protein [Steroidobacteraceae bacterium]|jgi:uncharacterized protein (DUF1800 family)|nr:DUF1800 domain-containing protein [Steroidobacteraceae bacterium]
MRDATAAAIATNRFGLGARPGEIAACAADPRGWLEAQLRGNPPVISDSGLQSSAAMIATIDKVRADNRQAKAGAAAANAVVKLGAIYRPAYIGEVTARLRQAAITERPFLERITQFWSNHFAVSVDKAVVLGVAGSYEREAIRPNVLGSFAQLLLAVERHPAMLMYLDNFRSVGPDSMLAGRTEERTGKTLGINENLAREIMELHTLGVNGGYTQADVTAFAKVITGWSIGAAGKGIVRGGEPGEFFFRANIHEPGPQTIMGKRYGQQGHAQGEAVLLDLARSPATAQHIATQLARHFVADDPPPQSVNRLARVFSNSGGDLASVYRALIAEDTVWSQPLSKFKTPNDYVISAWRALAMPIDAARNVPPLFANLGQRVWSPNSPAGWPDRSVDWDGASALMQRLRWADEIGQRFGSSIDGAQLAPQVLGATLSANTRQALSRAASAAQAVTLLMAAPEFMRR